MNQFMNTARELKELQSSQASNTESLGFNIKPTLVYSEVLKRKKSALLKNLKEDESENRTSSDKVVDRHSSPSVNGSFKKNVFTATNYETGLPLQRPTFIRKKSLDRPREYHEHANVVELPSQNEYVEDLLNIESTSVIPELPLKTTIVVDYEYVDGPLSDDQNSVICSEHEDIYDNMLQSLPSPQTVSEQKHQSGFNSLRFIQDGYVTVNIIKQPDWPKCLGKKLFN
jgi:hypothetical protein